jgi:hypothetical protein
MEDTVRRFKHYLESIGSEGKVDLEFEEECISRTRVKFTSNRTVIVIKKPIEYT